MSTTLPSSGYVSARGARATAHNTDPIRRRGLVDADDRDVAIDGGAAGALGGSEEVPRWTRHQSLGYYSIEQCTA
jgi:hypothetical protein